MNKILFLLSIVTAVYSKESEPYYQDKVWHFVASSMITEQYYNATQNRALSSITSLVAMTYIEMSDEFSGCGFSWRDEVGDVLGVAFGILKSYYPALPIDVKIGLTTGNIHDCFDFKKLGNGGPSMYSKTYASIVYRAKDYYVGPMITTNKDYTDQYGIVAGYDLSGVLAKVFQNKYLSTFMSHISMGLEYRLTF